MLPGRGERGPCSRPGAHTKSVHTMFRSLLADAGSGWAPEKRASDRPRGPDARAQPAAARPWRCKDVRGSKGVANGQTDRILGRAWANGWPPGWRPGSDSDSHTRRGTPPSGVPSFATGRRGLGAVAACACGTPDLRSECNQHRGRGELPCQTPHRPVQVRVRPTRN